MVAVTATTLSIVAVAMSAAAFAWSIGWSVYTHRRMTKASLTVQASFAFPVYGARVGEQALSVTVANGGMVPTTVTSVVFGIKGSKESLVPLEWIVQEPRPLPIVLAPASGGRASSRGTKSRAASDTASASRRSASARSPKALSGRTAGRSGCLCSRPPTSHAERWRSISRFRASCFRSASTPASRSSSIVCRTA
jgi:hypothetical protein